MGIGYLARCGLPPRGQIFGFPANPGGKTNKTKTKTERKTKHGKQEKQEVHDAGDLALGHAVGILVGQSLGAGEFERAKKESFTLIWFTALICIGMTVILAALSRAFPQLYNTTEEVRALAQKFIVISALFFPVQGILNSLYFTLRSGGKTLVTFAFDSVFSWGVTVPLALILCFCTDLGILTVFTVIQAVDIIKIVIGAVMIATIDSAIPQMGIGNSMITEFIKGILLLVAILLNVILQRIAEKQDLARRNI